MDQGCWLDWRGLDTETQRGGGTLLGVALGGRGVTSQGTRKERGWNWRRTHHSPSGTAVPAPFPCSPQILSIKIDDF